MVSDYIRSYSTITSKKKLKTPFCWFLTMIAGMKRFLCVKKGLNVQFLSDVLRALHANFILKDLKNIKYISSKTLKSEKYIIHLPT